MSQLVSWYTLRTVATSEDKFLDLFHENISHYKLKDKVFDAQILREFKIEESEEFSPDSDFLPKRGFKSGKSSVWVRLGNGNYKKIKLVEKKPLKGLIFIKMEHNHELFRQIKSWNMGVMFLGDPNPVPISEEKFQAMKGSLNPEIPSIEEYVSKNNYLLVEGKVPDFFDLKVQKNDDYLETDNFSNIKKESDSLPEPLLEKTDEMKKTEIYFDLNIDSKTDDFLDDMNLMKKSNKKKNDEKFKVNDFVYLKDLGFKGIIQSIDYGKNTAIVSIQMFGRRQPINCKINELTEI